MHECMYSTHTHTLSHSVSPLNIHIYTHLHADIRQSASCKIKKLIHVSVWVLSRTDYRIGTQNNIKPHHWLFFNKKIISGSHIYPIFSFHKRICLSLIYHLVQPEIIIFSRCSRNVHLPQCISLEVHTHLNHIKYHIINTTLSSVNGLLCYM